MPPSLTYVDTYMMGRASGWQAVIDVKTLLRVYARRVIDEHIDMYRISLSVELIEADWAKSV